MAYSTNPNLPKARAIAMQLLIRDSLPLAVVANRCGVHRSTIYRWRRKWEVLNQHVQMNNLNRPNRVVNTPSGVSNFRLASCVWRIPTHPSTPKTSPTALSEESVKLVLAVRAQLKRCAEVVWHHVNNVLGVNVSLSSVRRILWRSGVARGRKPRVKRDNPKRPLPTKPGELVQTDTIHHVDPSTGKRLYYYTVIDLYTRMTYTRAYGRILPGLAAKAVLEAREYFGFSFEIIQADNGPEFGRYFEQVLKGKGVAVRHSRLGRPNDNAHIERFNRTIQEECIGHYWRRSVPLQHLQEKVDNYTRFYNEERIHLGIQMRTPSEMLQRS